MANDLIPHPRNGSPRGQDPAGDLGLRADLVVAMCIGIALGGASGTLEALADASAEEVQAAMEIAFKELRQPGG